MLEQTSLCPSKYELIAFCDGRLPDQELERIAEHLDACETCEASFLVLDSARGGLRFRRDAAALVRDDRFADEPQLKQMQERAVVHFARPADRETPASTVHPNLPERLAHFRVCEEIGRGGMGTVYRCMDEQLDCVVAVKVLRTDLSSRPRFVERFQREKKTLGQLDHPNVIRARTAGVQDSLHFIVMDYVAGLDVSQLVRDVGPLQVGDACNMILQAARGLDYIHQLGFVHRDIKPSNLMLADTGTIKILDMGLARIRYESVSSEELTSSGYVLGTLDYMAPEQFSDSRSVDIRADIYSLGCTFHKLLTGRAPFSGGRYRNAHAKLQAHLNAPFPNVAASREDVPTAITEIIARMAAKSPADRFQSPAEIVEQLAVHTASADLQSLSRTAGVIESQAATSARDQPVPETSRSDRAKIETLDTRVRLPATPGAARGIANALAFAVAAAALCVTLAGLLGLGMLGLTSRDSGAGLGAVTQSSDAPGFDGRGVPLRWYNLFEREPRRLWPSGWETARVRYSAQQQDVTVDEPDIVFLQLGQTSAANIRLQVTVSNTAFVGNGGLFWGYRETTDTSSGELVKQCHVVWVQCYQEGNQPQLELIHELLALHPNPAGVRPNITSIDSRQVDVSFLGKLDEGERLEIEVGRGLLRAVSWADQELSEIVKLPRAPEESPASNQGGFGIVAKQGSALFRDARFMISRETGE